MRKRIDITGNVYGDLTVIKLSEEVSPTGTRLWECRCSCGETKNILASSLKAGHYKSCGCKQRAKRDAGVKSHIKTDQVDGTRKSALRVKKHKDNTSGHKGVSWAAGRGKWLATIGFKGKVYNLGYYISLEDAVAARKAAEEKYHKPYLEDDHE